MPFKGFVEDCLTFRFLELSVENTEASLESCIQRGIRIRGLFRMIAMQTQWIPDHYHFYFQVIYFFPSLLATEIYLILSLHDFHRPTLMTASRAKWNKRRKMDIATRLSNHT